MTRLSDAALAQLPPDVRAPAYDRAATRVGVVHFGPGAFFRAHVASFLDTALERDPGLAACAVSLRSGAVTEALQPQDGLYTLVQLAAEPQLRVIGALKTVLTATDEGAASVRRQLADPDLRLVTLTVTEKGYTLGADGALDLGHPDVRHDLAHPGASPLSVVGWIASGLAERRAAGRSPFVTLSCDNLSGNGAKLRAATVAFAEALAGHEGLADWIRREARFPSTMVDSITPATDAALRSLVHARLGLEDAWPVQREPFAQWVVEDDFGADVALRDSLAAAGATLAADVAPFERAKLRLLNGAHSTLAYLGLLGGLETVAEAMAEPRLAGFVERLVRGPIAATLAPVPALDVPAYIDAVLARFRNPAVRHALAQIAWDGSQKLPVRLLGTIADALARGGDPSALAAPVAAWMRVVRLRAERGETLVDPLAPVLTARLSDGGPQEVAALLGVEAVFPPALAADPRFRDAVQEAHARLGRDPLDLP